MSITQDKKGFMWFGTWNGLSKFDGYRFKTYKSTPSDPESLINNRVDLIIEDSYQYIWVLSYDGQVHRFDPRSEKFNNIPINAHERSNRGKGITHIQHAGEGKMWLLSDTEGCFRIETDPETHNLTSHWYSTKNKKLPSDIVNKIYTDPQKNSWIMTKQGMISVDSVGNSYPVHYPSSVHQPIIYDALYSGGHMWFSSSSGQIFRQSDNGISELIQLPTEDIICSIKQLKNKQLLFLTERDGFFIYDITTRQISHVKQDTFPLQARHQQMISAFIDSHNEIWLLLSETGVLHHNLKNGTTDYFWLKGDVINPYSYPPTPFISEDCKGRLWIRPSGGAFSYYDRQENKLKYFYNAPEDPARKFSNILHTAFSDRQGNLWLCTHSKGLEKISFVETPVEILRPNTSANSFSVNEVRFLFKDDQNNLWVATKEGSLYLYDRNYSPIGRLLDNGKIGNGTPFKGIVYCIFQDKDKNIWLGTKGNGLYKLTGKDIHSGFRMVNFKHDRKNPFSLSHNNVYCVTQDTEGRIWIATYGGGINYIDTANGKTRFIHPGNQLKNYPMTSCFRTRHICCDKNGNMFVGTTGGLLCFSTHFTSPESLEFNHLRQDNMSKDGLTANDVHYIYPASDNTIYIGTFGGGLLKITPPYQWNERFKFENYISQVPQPSDIVYSITEDSRGYIWMGTESTITKFKPKENTFENYGIESGIDVRYFSEATICKMGKDILLGSDDGIYIFSPEKLKKQDYFSPLTFSRFLLFGREVDPTTEDSPLKELLDDQEEMTLTHKQSDFSIEFSTLDFRDPSLIHYAYKLEGFDKNWTYANNQRTATYTNLPKGEYTFRVKSTNSDGKWIDNERELKIKVLPSFWNSTAGYIFYIIVLLLIMGTVMYVLFTIYRLKHEVQMEHTLTQMKLRFFTDISHELRTPLTLIAGPVDYILHNEKVNPEVKEQLQLVERNTNRMLRLINEILDFRKIQNKKMRLSVEEINFGVEVQRICENFYPLAEERHIHFSVEDHSHGAILWADKEKLETILSNLLSNAFKFTFSNKSITVKTSETNDNLILQVSDEGIGINKDKINSIFDRFSSSEKQNLSKQPGTGVGMHLTKELINMHGATIQVKSIEGKGSTFTVTFRKGYRHFGNEADLIKKELTTETTDKETKNIQENIGYTDNAGNPMQESTGKPVILVVEDNTDLQEFLRTILCSEYEVHKAINGADALNRLSNLQPDIVISDVMMPEMDGIEFTRKLKEDINTSHIPVILLTAKSSLENQMEGLENGADDYITKPFSATYLKAKIENILRARKKLQEYYASHSTDNKNSETKSPDQPVLNSRDQKFIDTITVVLEKELDNSDFTIDELVSQVGLGRTVFFKKLKALTGLSPVEYIREFRLTRATELICNDEYNISQISYMVGISDPRYFSRCFKQKYGMTPTEYKDKIQGKNK